MDTHKKIETNPEAEEINEKHTEHIHHKRKKRLVRRYVVLSLLIIIPVLISSLAPHNKPTLQLQNPLIAKVQNQPIYLSDVRNVALEQYQPKAVDKNALHLSYDILIERLILDKEAQRLSLSVSDKEIADKLQEDRTQPIPKAFFLATKYELLKEKIIKATIKSREAYSIGFYIASYDEQQGSDVTDQERALFNKQRKDSSQALNQIEQKLKQGELPLHVAKTIFNTYPSLQPILAVNGYILQSINQEKVLENPKLYTYDEYNANQPFFDAVYSMKPNEIRKIEDTNGSGGDVIQVKWVNPTGADSYEAWLDSKKQELVTTYSYKL